MRYTYVILFCSRRPGGDCKSVLTSGLGERIKVLEFADNCWLVATSLQASDVRDQLLEHIHADDTLLVLSVGLRYSTWNDSPEVRDWLREHWYPVVIGEVR